MHFHLFYLFIPIFLFFLFVVLKSFPQTPITPLWAPEGPQTPVALNDCNSLWWKSNSFPVSMSVSSLRWLMISLMKLMSNSFHAHIALSPAAVRSMPADAGWCSVWSSADLHVSVSCSSWCVHLWRASSSDGENRSTSSWSRATLRGDWRCGASQKHPPPQVLFNTRVNSIQQT